jgi:hypothetical protein
MTRKQVKRLLALLKTEAEKDKSFGLELPEGFKASFENQSLFKGWVNYHVTWDVDDNDVWKVISLKQSRVDDWHDELRKVVPVITPEGEIVSAEEWDRMEAAKAES